MKRCMLIPLLLVSLLLLSGCLFTVNHPQLALDGTVAVFLEDDGSYTLFPETGLLHLLRGEEWIPVDGATLAGTGGLLDLSPDGTEGLYVDTTSEGFLEGTTSTVYRVPLRPEAAPKLIWETDETIVRAAWADDETILFFTFGDEGLLGALRALDPVAGRLEQLAVDLLSFAVCPDRDELVLLVADQNESPSIGTALLWNPADDVRTILASFALNDLTLESYGMLPHSFLWDISPDGAWLALCLYDSTLIEPMANPDVPSLYLIDVEGGEAERIAEGALMPAFSPDGTGLIYAAQADDETAILMWRDVLTEGAEPIEGSKGISTAFWLSPTQLGMTFEGAEERYRLVMLDLIAEEFTELVGDHDASDPE